MTGEISMHDGLGLIQDFRFETDSLSVFEDMLRTALSLTGCHSLHVYEYEGVLGIPNADYPSKLVAKLSQEPYDFSPLTNRYYWLICSVDECQSPAYGTKSTPEIQEALVQRIMELLHMADRDKFWQECGTEGPFAGCDDGVGIGYRLDYSSTFGSSLDISLCHILYPK